MIRPGGELPRRLAGQLLGVTLGSQASTSRVFLIVVFEIVERPLKGL